MFLHILAALACVLGAIMQCAVHRAPDIIDKRMSVTMARRLTIAALVLAVFYIFGGSPQTIVSLIFGLFGLGQALFATHKLKLDLHDGTHA